MRRAHLSAAAWRDPAFVPVTVGILRESYLESLNFLLPRPSSFPSFDILEVGFKMTWMRQCKAPSANRMMSIPNHRTEPTLFLIAQSQAGNSETMCFAETAANANGGGGARAVCEAWEDISSKPRRREDSKHPILSTTRDHPANAFFTNSNGLSPIGICSASSCPLSPIFPHVLRRIAMIFSSS